MAEITSLSTLAKASLDTSNDFLLIANSSNKTAKKFLTSNLLPSFNTSGSGGQDLYVSVTNSNQLNLKGLKSGDTGLLTVTTASNNIELTVLEAGIDLSLCNNVTSGFISSVDFTGSVTGECGVTNGGTSLSTIAKGAMLYASDTDTIAATAAMSTNGQLLIGNATNGYPSVATLTAGSNVTITNTAGAISIAAALTGLAADLDCNTYDINLDHAAGVSWLSGDGTAEGVSVDADGKVFIGDSTPSLPTIAGQLHLCGTTTNALVIGNTNDYKAHNIKAMNPASGTAGMVLTIDGADGAAGNSAGGGVILSAGDAHGSGTGGDLKLYAGDSGSGTRGDIEMYTYPGGTATQGLTLDAASDVTVNAGSLIITGAAEGIVHTNSGTVTQATDHTTGVTLNTTSGVITLAAVALANATNAEFTVTNSTVQADSVILVTMQDENTTNNAQLSCAVHTIAGGSFKISVHHADSAGATSTTASKIHFLVINNSV